MNNDIDFRNKVIEFRSKYELSRNELAHLAGLTQATIAAVEDGKRIHKATRHVLELTLDRDMTGYKKRLTEAESLERKTRRIYHQMYYQENRDKILAYQRRRSAETREKRKAYRQSHLEECRAKDAETRNKRRDKVRAYNTEYQRRRRQRLKDSANAAETSGALECNETVAPAQTVTDD